MSHTMKLWEKIIEHRLRLETMISKRQFGFMRGRSTTEAIYLLRGLTVKCRSRRRDLHTVFIDLEKVYDRVAREVLWAALDKKGVCLANIKILQDMYDGVLSKVKTPGGEKHFL